jgi:hypothetical protein
MNHNRTKQAKSATLDLGTLQGSGSRKNSVGQNNKSDLFQFSLANRSSFSASLTNLKANADLKLLNGSRAEIATSAKRGKQAEQIALTLEPGTYYIKINVVKKGATPFELSYSATPVSSSPAPVTNSPAPVTSSPAPSVGINPVNTLPGRTENDYASLAVAANLAALDFFNNGNPLSYKRFNGINELLAGYAGEGDDLALKYFQLAINAETAAQASAALRNAIRRSIF